jgi:valyl-tRNA synthetase
MQLPPSASSDVIIVSHGSDEESSLAEKNRSIIESLIKIKTLSFTSSTPTISFCAQAKVSSLTIIIPLPEEMKEKEKQRLVKEKDKLSSQEESLRLKLCSTDFAEKAPKEVVQKLQGQLDQIQTQLFDVDKKLKEYTAE